MNGRGFFYKCFDWNMVLCRCLMVLCELLYELIYRIDVMIEVCEHILTSNFSSSSTLASIVSSFSRRDSSVCGTCFGASSPSCFFSNLRLKHHDGNISAQVNKHKLFQLLLAYLLLLVFTASHFVKFLSWKVELVFQCKSLVSNFVLQIFVYECHTHAEHAFLFDRNDIDIYFESWQNKQSLQITK